MKKTRSYPNIAKESPPKIKEEPSTPSERMEKAKLFAKALVGENPPETKKSPPKVQEELPSPADRMQKAKIFSKKLSGRDTLRTHEEPTSELHLSIAKAMRKMLSPEDEGVTDTKKRKVTETPEKEQTTIDIYKELKQEQKEVHELYNNLTRLTEVILHNIEEERPVKPEAVEAQISEIAGKLILGSQEILVLSTKAKGLESGDYLASSMIDVSIIAMKIGTSLGYNKSKLVQLGGSAFFANVGMIKLMPIATRPGRLKSKEYAKIKEHPSYGADILGEMGFPDIYIKVALQHHEKEDGTGYPAGLSGNSIHEFAAITGLAEIVESLSHNRAFRPSMPIHIVVKEVVENWKGSFSSRIMRALVQALGVYPVGTLVELSSGEIAKIIKNNPSSPLRPIVQIIKKGEEETNHPRIIDLMGKPLLYVKRPAENTEAVIK